MISSIIIIYYAIIIIIIFKLHCQLGFSGHYPSIRPNYPLLPAGFPNNILCQHRVYVKKFLVIGQHWYVHM